MLTTNEKAVEALKEKGVQAKEENNTVYITVNDVDFELSSYEIEYQANEYEE